MSDCAESYLFYGVVYESAADFPWTKTEGFGEWGFDGWCKANLSEALEKALYVGRWGNEYRDETAWFIAVQSTLARSDWNNPTKTNLPENPNIGVHLSILREFYTKAEKFGLPWVGEERVGWHLVSFYG